VMRMNQNSVVEEIQSRIATGDPRTIHLLDNRSAGVFGGSGGRFDWTILAALNPAPPVIVAGGLTPENVEELIVRYKPWGVDVSSGVETLGQKDPAKILAFIHAVRQADASLKGVNNVAR
jgi:phosphoribosylanthranilate isomerase